MSSFRLNHFSLPKTPRHIPPPISHCRVNCHCQMERQKEVQEVMTSKSTKSTLTSTTPSTAPKPKLYKDFILGGTASVTAVCFTNPLEVAKTRLQLQGELVKRLSSSSTTQTYNGAFDALKKIFLREGIWALQKGLAPAALFQLSMNGSRLGSYSVIQKHFLHHTPTKEGGSPSAVFMLKNALAGACAGAIGAAIGSPFFLVKTRLQSQSNSATNAVGHQYKYRGSFHALSSIFREEGGIRGLYRGASASIMRLSIGSAAQLSTYDQTKGLILWTETIEDGFHLHLTASLVTGLLVTTVMNPFDVMSTRMYNQRVEGGKNTLYKNPIDCLLKIVRTEGIRGLYKGWTAHYLRLGPHTVLTFIFWEHLKKLAQKHQWFD